MKTIVFVLLAISLIGCAGRLANFTSYSVAKDDGGYIITNSKGVIKKITAYGDEIIRLQSLGQGEKLLPNHHYEMVERHDWGNNIAVTKSINKLIFTTNKVKVEVDSETLAATFFLVGSNSSLLQEVGVTSWQDNTIQVRFDVDSTEHFTGLGHGYYARESGIDLKGKVVERNYGSSPIEQAPLPPVSG